MDSFIKPSEKLRSFLIYFVYPFKPECVHIMMGFPGDSAGKEPTCNAGDLGLIPGLGRSPGEGNSYPLQYSGLENSMDYIVHGVAKNWTQLSDFHSLIHILYYILYICICTIYMHSTHYRRY